MSKRDGSISLLQLLFLLPTDQLERLAPLEPLLMRAEEGSHFQSVNSRFISLPREWHWTTGMGVKRSSIPQRSDSFAWRFWHASFHRAKQLVQADPKRAAEAAHRLEKLLSRLVYIARNSMCEYLDEDEGWGFGGRPAETEQVLRFVRLVCDTLEGEPLHARRMWHKQLSQVTKARIGDHMHIREPLLQRWLHLCPESATDLFAADGPGQALLSRCDEEIEQLQQRINRVKERKAQYEAMRDAGHTHNSTPSQSQPGDAAESAAAACPTDAVAASSQ